VPTGIHVGTCVGTHAGAYGYPRGHLRGYPRRCLRVSTWAPAWVPTQVPTPCGGPCPPRQARARRQGCDGENGENDINLASDLHFSFRPRAHERNSSQPLPFKGPNCPNLLLHLPAACRKSLRGPLGGSGCDEFRSRPIRPFWVYSCRRSAAWVTCRSISIVAFTGLPLGWLLGYWAAHGICIKVPLALQSWVLVIW